MCYAFHSHKSQLKLPWSKRGFILLAWRGKKEGEEKKFGVDNDWLLLLCADLPVGPFKQSWYVHLTEPITHEKQSVKWYTLPRMTIDFFACFLYHNAIQSSSSFVEMNQFISVKGNFTSKSIAKQRSELEGEEEAVQIIVTLNFRAAAGGLFRKIASARCYWASLLCCIS